MIEAGVRTIEKGPGIVSPGIIHRLAKADTAQGLISVQSIADLGAPYPVLLYERFLGRPYQDRQTSESLRATHENHRINQRGAKVRPSNFWVS